jgi:hypothetical protein
MLRALVDADGAMRYEAVPGAEDMQLAPVLRGCPDGTVLAKQMRNGRPHGACLRGEWD